MIDHSKIKDAIDSYFNNTPTAKIIENLDRHAVDRNEDLARENIDRPSINNKKSISAKLLRFEEVSPASQDAAFIATSIESLVAPIGLPNDMGESPQSLYLLRKQILIKDILDRSMFYRNLRSAELSHTNLSHASLRYADLIRADLSHANLICADLIYANLTYANLSGTNLTGANLSSASLRNTILVGANLNGADLRDTNLREANLSDADVKNTKFGYNSGVSESMKQDLIARGAIFDLPLEENYDLKF